MDLFAENRQTPTKAPRKRSFEVAFPDDKEYISQVWTHSPETTNEASNFLEPRSYDLDEMDLPPLEFPLEDDSDSSNDAASSISSSTASPERERPGSSLSPGPKQFYSPVTPLDTPEEIREFSRRPRIPTDHPMVKNLESMFDEGRTPPTPKTSEGHLEPCTDLEDVLAKWKEYNQWKQAYLKSFYNYHKENKVSYVLVKIFKEDGGYTYEYVMDNGSSAVS